MQKLGFVWSGMVLKHSVWEWLFVGPCLNNG
jgi:hypothetical protein